MPGIRHILRALSRSGVYRPDFLNWVPVGDDFTANLCGIRFRYRYTPPDEIGAALYWRGALRTFTIQPLVALARSPSTSLIIDIGANAGVMALVMAAAGNARVIAFEPLPEMRSRLEQNVALNAWTDRITVRPEAIGNTDGTARFYPYGSTQSSLQPQSETDFYIEVPTRRLDTLDLNPEVVKIDVEGAELGVLDGSLETLRRSQPVVILECRPSSPGDYMTSLMRDCGYIRFGHIRDGYIKEVDRIGVDAHTHEQDYVCLAPRRFQVCEVIGWRSASGKAVVCT